MSLLLLENGDGLQLEDGSGDLLLELDDEMGVPRVIHSFGEYAATIEAVGLHTPVLDAFGRRR